MMIRGNGTGGYRQPLSLCERYNGLEMPSSSRALRRCSQFLFDAHHHRLTTFSAICIDEQPF
jgi:hypothetical protein